MVMQSTQAQHLPLLGQLPSPLVLLSLGALRRLPVRSQYLFPSVPGWISEASTVRISLLLLANPLKLLELRLFRRSPPLLILFPPLLGQGLIPAGDRNVL